MNNVTLILLMILVIAAGSMLAYFVYQQQSPHNSPLPPPPTCKSARWRLADPEEFYSNTTTGTGAGRNTEGDYVDKNGKVLEAGFKTSADLAKHPLTFAHGHPYYSQKKGDGTGVLAGSNWSSYARSLAPSLSTCNALKGQGKVLVLEEGAAAVLDGDAEFEGVVVRRGGALFVAGDNVSLRTSFVLVESGGLLQAGSSYNPQFRFDGKFTLTLTSPAQGGYGVQGVPASQYSYKVYTPGVDTSLTGPNGEIVFASFTGMPDMFVNKFGPKCLCGGFNGNIHLAGALGPLVDYHGTWNAYDDKNEPIFDDSDRFSVGVDWLPRSYAVTWAPLAPGVYAKGSKSVKVAASGNSLQWWKNKEVVVLACPQQYTTRTDATGLLPIWLNDSDPTQRDANSKANEEFLKTFSDRAPSPGTTGTVPGVEVARVIDVGDDGTLTFADSLQFDHSAQQLQLTRSFGKYPKTIKVDTVPHVALLSRNILITSEFVTPGGGCNLRHDSVMENATTKLGPGGGVLCNSDGVGAEPSKEVYSTCYAPGMRTDETLYCGPSATIPDGSSIPGHWLWGTAGKNGCGAIHGGQTMYRYGCAVRLDSVELKRIGTPGNFGTIGQYAIHFHLAGFARAFRNYLPEGGQQYSRECVVANCGIWLSLSRWITLHGTVGAEISNNVGFMTFGSGYFAEDGTEFMNTIDHNLGAYAIPAVQSNYLNPTPLFPNVATDFSQMSVFWLKNNYNILARNVAACCPSPVIGFWLVPQPVASLRGISAVCIGSQDLGLPGFGSQGCAIGGGSNGLSQNLNNNKSGSLASVAGNGDKTACWVPTDETFKFPLIVDREYSKTGYNKCLAYNTSNSEVSLPGFMENVAYAIYMLIGDMPEMLAAGGPRFKAFKLTPFGITSQLQDNENRPQWMPHNGQNSCTDKILSAYPELTWSEDLPYQPLTEQEITDASSSTASQNVKARLLPKIFSGLLTYCLGPFQGLWGGVAWFKGTPAWTLNSAFLDLAPDGSQMTTASPNPPGYTNNTVDARTSTVFEQSLGMSDISGWNKYYPVYANFISNGCVSIPAQPSLWIGDKTFLSDRVVFGDDKEEYANSGLCNTAKCFCDFGSTGMTLSDIFPNPMELGIIAKQSPQCTNNHCPPSTIYLYDLNAKTLAPVPSTGSAGKVSWTAAPKPPPGGAGQAKFPFVCTEQKLRRTNDGLQSDFNAKYNLGDVTANLTTRHFFTTGAQNLGDRICAGMTQIPPNLPAMGWPGA